MENKKYQLPKEFATKWVEALRSGKYEQLRGHMIAYKNGNPCYCSLGVSAIVSGFRDNELQSKFSVTPTMRKLNPSYPIELTGNYRTNKLLNSISRLNDISELSFLEIADWIEVNVEFI